MCGIAGMLGTQIEPLEVEQLSRALLHSLRHRGPDDQGWLLSTPRGVRSGDGPTPACEAEAVLLHHRLSILDPSSAGRQPMSTDDGRYVLVFNGAIHNYLEVRAELESLGVAFRSGSDTEVLLYAYRQWGRQALPRFVGMFAFAVLDRLKRTLFLARDFFGIKPLYYTHWRRGFAFASEIKALLELPGVGRTVEPQRVFDYLREGLTDHGDRTFFANIRQLPAAHCLEIALDLKESSSPERYWSVETSSRHDLSFSEAANTLRELFLESIEQHMRSDVPIGAALSGGIDSSAVVSAMRYLRPGLELNTFSYLADDPALNEERWVDLVGASAHTRSFAIRPSPGELQGDIDELIRIQDEPFGSTSIYAQYRVFRSSREAGIKVMLDGQGADELLGGYRPYLSARLATLLRQRHWKASYAFAKHSGNLTHEPWKTSLRAGGILLPPYLRRCARKLLGVGRTPSWMNEAWFREHGAGPRREARGGPEHLREQLVRSLTETSLPMLLRYEDRNAMAHGIESRVPFLTPALASFVLSLPEEYLIAPDGTSKAVFRQALRGIVPDAILNRKDKIGFATPERVWLTTLGSWVDQTLCSEGAKRIPALDTGALRREWQKIRQGRAPFDFRVWRWVNLIRWSELWDVSYGES